MSYVWLIGNLLHGNFISGIMSTKALESAIGMLHSEFRFDIFARKEQKFNMAEND